MSNGRSDFPLNQATARLRSSSEVRLTKAHEEREMRKMEEGPAQGSLLIGELKNLQSSSCEVLAGLRVSVRAWDQVPTHTLPTHITQSLRFAGG